MYSRYVVYKILTYHRLLEGCYECKYFLLSTVPSSGMFVRIDTMSYETCYSLSETGSKCFIISAK